MHTCRCEDYEFTPQPDADGLCVRCAEGCLECLKDAKTCTRCADGYILLNETATCSIKCSDGQCLECPAWDPPDGSLSAPTCMSCKAVGNATVCTG